MLIILWQCVPRQATQDQCAEQSNYHEATIQNGVWKLHVKAELVEVRLRMQ